MSTPACGNMPLSLYDACGTKMKRSAIRRGICVLAWLGMLLPFPAKAIDHTQLAVVINTADPLSVQIGKHYAVQRRIPVQNIIEVAFSPVKASLTRKEFEVIKVAVERQVPPGVQAYALTWAAPYRVDCMSITSAFAFGFDSAFCAEGCGTTRPSMYFNSPAQLPFTQLGIRPAMSIAATSFEKAKALIDRGVQADGSRPLATAYLLATSDRARNVRNPLYPVLEKLLGKGRVRASRLEQEALRNAGDVLFYFTGRASVDGLETLHFVPGAIADHLTSFGGMLHDSPQMSVLRWLEAGATGSYGTVVEPCAIAAKFPNPVVVAGWYLRGETLIEAYWKSVAMPGQGLFVGEPLAAPFRRLRAAGR